MVVYEWTIQDMAILTMEAEAAGSHTSPMTRLLFFQMAANRRLDSTRGNWVE